MVTESRMACDNSVTWASLKNHTHQGNQTISMARDNVVPNLPYGSAVVLGNLREHLVLRKDLAISHSPTPQTCQARTEKPDGPRKRHRCSYESMDRPVPCVPIPSGDLPGIVYAQNPDFRSRGVRIVNSGKHPIVKEALHIAVVFVIDAHYFIVGRRNTDQPVTFRLQSVLICIICGYTTLF